MPKNYPFKKVKGVSKTQCKCGAMLDACHECKLRTRCPSCAICLSCGMRVHETWCLDPKRPVRYDMKQGDQDKGKDLVIPKNDTPITKVEILGKHNRARRRL